MLGLGGLPLIPIPHPLAGNPTELVTAKGMAVVDDVLHALTTPASELADEHRRRFVRLTQRRLEGGAVCTDESCAIDLALG